jgi:hypothetical protein
MAVKYSSRTFFTYETDYPLSLAPGDTVELPFNTHGDSDFFWQKFAAFSLISGTATTRTGDQLPALSMSILNQTTGRLFMQEPVALPNISSYLQFLPHMGFWPRKSSILVTLFNEDPAGSVTLTCTDGSYPDGQGIGSSGEDAQFYGYSSATAAPFAAVGDIDPSPGIVNAETIALAGTFAFGGSSYFYIIANGGTQDLFTSVTTQLNGGPVNNYTSADALFLGTGDSGVINGVPVTAEQGPTWFWLDGNADFNDGGTTVLVFSFGGTSYSLLQLSFMGTKAFPKT